MAKTFALGVGFVAAGLALAWFPLALIFLGAVLISAALFLDIGDLENE